MLFLTAADLSDNLPFWAAVGAALAIALIVMGIRGRMKSGAASASGGTAPAAAPAPRDTRMPAPGSLGEVALHGVEPRTAAMLMAILADEMQTPLNEIRFISIKEV